MHSTIDFLKKALSRQPNAGMFGCYHVSQGFIYAQNETLQAIVPMESSDHFSVPGEELEAALSRSTVEPHLQFENGDLTVKAGRLKATIPCLMEEPPSIFTREVIWKPLPDMVVPALQKACQFIIGNNQIGWTSGIRLEDGHLTCLNNLCGIDIALPGWESPPSVMTKEGAEFLLADPPVEYAVKQGALLFRWADDRSVQAQLIDQKMPDVVGQIFSNAGPDAPTSITADWREAFADAASIADDIIEVRQKSLRIGKGASKVIIETDIDVPAGHVSHWAAKVLAPMVTTATHWNPSAWPRPAFFTGPGLYGVVMGIKK